MERLKVLEVIRTVDNHSFQPMLNVTFQAALEPLQDSKIQEGNEKAYADFGRELMKMIELAVPKRAPGIIIYSMNMPVDRAKYIKADGEPFEIYLEASTWKLESLGEIEDCMLQAAGPDADIFFYKLLSHEIVIEEAGTLKKKIIYMVRFAFVTRETRKDYHVEHCVSHQQGD